MCNSTSTDLIFTNRKLCIIQRFVKNVEVVLTLFESIDTVVPRCYNKVKATDNGVGIPDMPLSVFLFEMG